MKKLIALVLALALVALCAVASAGTIVVQTGTSAADGTESQDVLAGETYNAYKLLHYTAADTDGDGTNDAFSYYLNNTDAESMIGQALAQQVGFTLLLSSDGTRLVLQNADDFADDPQAIVNGIRNIPNTTAFLDQYALDKKTATPDANKQAVFTGLTPGYWFVMSSTGSLCTLTSYEDEALIVEKNTIPTVDKTQKTTGDEYVNDTLDTHIGETVHYQVVITDGVGTNAALTMTDTMTSGLDYTTNSLKINGTSVADDADTANWKVTVSGRTITIEFSATYVNTLDSGDTITVTYDATINKNAVIDSATGNENKVELDYSNQHQEDKVYVETYDFIVYKTDGTNFLDGAEFKLYDAQGAQILLSSDTTGYYVDANGSADTTIDINAATGCNVRGIEPGTYYLEEVVVPDGYNKLLDREAVTITTGATAAVEITVENTAGTILPSTGGIGTTIFYIVGGLLVIGAAVILVARRKAHE